MYILGTMSINIDISTLPFLRMLSYNSSFFIKYFIISNMSLNKWASNHYACRHAISIVLVLVTFNRQECHEFQASLDSTVSSRLSWLTLWESILKKKKKSRAGDMAHWQNVYTGYVNPGFDSYTTKIINKYDT